MTRSELIERLARRFPSLKLEDARVSVDVVLEAIGTALASGRRIEVRGFGVFSLNYRPGRVGRNPKSGAEVSVPAKYVPHFKAGKALAERVERGAGWGSLLADEQLLNKRT